MTAIIVAIVTLALTILALVVKITVFTTEIRVWVDELRGERRLVKKIPVLEVRIAFLEQHIGVRAPSVEDPKDSE